MDGVVSATRDELRAALSGLTLRDERRLLRRLDRRDADLEAIGREVTKAQARIARRRDLVPEVSYPPDLPVAARVDDIAAALRDSQVVVVAGETGSGKTTQLPKVCLALGRGVRGGIAHTQPGGSRRAPLPSGWPRSSTSTSANASGTRCGSPGTSAWTPWSR
jgi:ATP-dependent helicase HrpA